MFAGRLLTQKSNQLNTVVNQKSPLAEHEQQSQLLITLGLLPQKIHERDSEVNQQSQPADRAGNIGQRPTRILHHLQDGAMLGVFIPSRLKECFTLIAQRVIHGDVYQPIFLRGRIDKSNIAGKILGDLRPGVTVKAEFIQMNGVGFVVPFEAQLQSIGLAIDFKFLGLVYLRQIIAERNQRAHEGADRFVAYQWRDVDRGDIDARGRFPGACKLRYCACGDTDFAGGAGRRLWPVAHILNAHDIGVDIEGINPDLERQ